MSNSSDLDSFIDELPKTELHLHLDGSLSPEFIRKAAELKNIQLPVEPEKIRTWLQEQKRSRLGKSVASGRNWPVFDFCNQFLQSGELIREATVDLLKRLAAKNVAYAEIRFCPDLHTKEGLTPEAAIEAVIAGFELVEGSIDGGVIICALRSLDQGHCFRMAELAGKYFQKSKQNPTGVVGFDVAGHEGAYPMDSWSHPMVSGVLRAKELKIPVTLHAGEWPGTLEGLKFAIKELSADRIGHGIALPLAGGDWIQENRPGHVEVCLTSNVAYGFKVKEYDQHPAKYFYKMGIPFSLNCDNLLLSGDFDNEADSCVEIKRLVYQVFRGNESQGWLAARQALKAGPKAAFSPKIDAEWVENFCRKVDLVFEKYDHVIKCECL